MSEGSGFKASFLTALTEVLLSDKEGVGCLRWEGNKCYKWCLFKNTTATVAGAAGTCVAYDAEDGHSNSHVVADLNDADSVPICAGTTGAAVTGTLATSYWCWIQIKGLVTVDTAITNGVDGTLCYLTTTDKTLAQASEADSAADYVQTVGIVADASAQTVILDCPF